MKIVKVNNISYTGFPRTQYRNYYDDNGYKNDKTIQDYNNGKIRISMKSLKNFFNRLLDILPWKKDKKGDKYIELDIKRPDDITGILAQINTIEDKNTKTTKFDSENNQQAALNYNKPTQKPPFPTPNFKDNPTEAQKFEYVESIKKYFDINDKELNLKAIDAVGKYGTGEQADYIFQYLSLTDDEMVQAAEKAYKEMGNPARIIEATEPLSGSIEDIKLSDETLLVVLDTIKALATIEAENGDFEYANKYVAKLLNHKSEKVREAAVYTYNKLNELKR